jgi:hypothetical protein
MIAHPIPIPAAAPAVTPFEVGGGREVDAAREVVIAEPEEVLWVVEAVLGPVEGTVGEVVLGPVDVPAEVVGVGVVGVDNELDAAALDGVLTGIGAAVI